MGKVEIIDSDLQQAVQYSKAIQEALRTSYDKSNDLKSYVKSAKWSGSNFNRFISCSRYLLYLGWASRLYGPK
ncbi:hypothetical protein COI73_31395 [Bacillus cereus]|uniref:hypothetical protein n=1 Tax=Bacillus proteolyticus TaxID=2026192 RepID=UPI000BF85211|nr:hypothetical protein COI73_31395 [Bacillus cereus]